MNKRERVAAAFKGLETDHAPVCMWKHVPSIYWNDDDKFAEVQAKFLRDTDVDFMKLSGDKFFGWPSPVLEDMQSSNQLYDIHPLGQDHPYIRAQIDRTKKVVNALGGECPSIYLVFAPLSQIRLKIGYPMMMKFIRENPEAMKYACNVVAQDLKLLVEGIIKESGADGIFFSAQNGEESRFSYEEYMDWVAPSDLEVISYANSISDMNAIHFCAWEAEPNRLANWKDYKAPVVSWSRYFDIMSIQRAKQHFKCTVWGGFDNRPGTFLYTATKEEIEKEVENLIAQGGKKGYIVGSDCSIHAELPDERIRWVADKVHSI